MQDHYNKVFKEFGSTPEVRELLSKYIPYAKSQLGQDLIAIAVNQLDSPGYFVEFGATNGVKFSNSWVLEHKLGWTGIIAEPARVWHDELKLNRKCIVDTRCVSDKSGESVKFLEVIPSEGVKGSAALSSIKEFANNGDWASDIRMERSKEYNVETVSLDDLLDQHGAPEEIHFMSIDTEGSEYTILNNFDFKKRKINLMCIEHNGVKTNREATYNLLTSNGYKRVAKHISRFDEWYVLV